jgi:TonB family protein
MTPWQFEHAARVTIVLLGALAASWCLRRRSAAARHWVLAASLVAAAALPLMTPLLPAWNPGIRMPPVMRTAPSAPPRAAAVVPTAVRGEAVTPAVAPPVDLPSWLRIIWMTGTGAGLAVLALGFLRLRWIASRARPVHDGRLAALAAESAALAGLRRAVRLRESDDAAMLATWGVFRPTLMVPAAAHQWTDGRARAVFRHELAHVRRHDWVVQLLSEALRCAYWFNPLVWIVAARLRHESEMACDDAVLRGGIEPADYAAHLLDVARVSRRRGPRWIPAPAMAQSSNLERRIGAMLDRRRSRAPLGRPARALVLTVAFSLAAAIGGLDVLAQTFATFSGSVLDPTNRVLPRATLVLTNLASEARYEVRSDATGRFEFVGLPPGSYALETLFPGFTRFIGAVTIAGERVQKDLTLEVGSLEETITIVGGHPAPVPPPPPPLTRPPVTRRSNADCTAPVTGGNLRPPRKLRHVKPKYPENLAALGAEGIVKMRAIIDEAGDVRDVTVTSPSQPDFDAAAIEAVRQWQFDSTLLNCQPVEVRMTVTANFKYQR